MVSKTYRFRKPVRVTRTHSSVTYGSSGGGGGGPSPKQPTVRVSSNVKKIGKTAEGKDLYGIDPNAGKVNYYYNPETGQKSYQVGSKVVPSGAIPITQQQFKSPEKLEVKTTVNPNEPVIIKKDKSGKVTYHASSRLGLRGGIVSLKSNDERFLKEEGRRKGFTVSNVYFSPKAYTVAENVLIKDKEITTKAETPSRIALIKPTKELSTFQTTSIPIKFYDVKIKEQKRQSYADSISKKIPKSVYTPLGKKYLDEPIKVFKEVALGTIAGLSDVYQKVVDYPILPTKVGKYGEVVKRTHLRTVTKAIFPEFPFETFKKSSRTISSSFVVPVSDILTSPLRRRNQTKSIILSYTGKLSDIGVSYVGGGYEGIRTKPQKSIIMAGAGFTFSGILSVLKGISSEIGLTMSVAKRISKLGPRTQRAVIKSPGYVLGGLYAGSVALDVAKTPKGKMAKKLGEITTTEVIPFSIGAATFKRFEDRITAYDYVVSKETGGGKITSPIERITKQTQTVGKVTPIAEDSDPSLLLKIQYPREKQTVYSSLSNEPSLRTESGILRTKAIKGKEFYNVLTTSSGKGKLQGSIIGDLYDIELSRNLKGGSLDIKYLTKGKNIKVIKRTNIITKTKNIEKEIFKNIIIDSFNRETELSKIREISKSKFINPRKILVQDIIDFSGLSYYNGKSKILYGSGYSQVLQKDFSGPEVTILSEKVIKLNSLNRIQRQWDLLNIDKRPSTIEYVSFEPRYEANLAKFSQLQGKIFKEMIKKSKLTTKQEFSSGIEYGFIISESQPSLLKSLFKSKKGGIGISQSELMKKTDVINILATKPKPKKRLSIPSEPLINLRELKQIISSSPTSGVGVLPPIRFLVPPEDITIKMPYTEVKSPTRTMTRSDIFTTTKIPTRTLTPTKTETRTETKALTKTRARTKTITEALTQTKTLTRALTKTLVKTGTRTITKTTTVVIADIPTVKIPKMILFPSKQRTPKRKKKWKFSEGEVFIPGFTSRALNFKVKTTRHKLFKQIKQKTFTGFEFRKIPVLA